jgi:hypothetical protein
VNTTFAFNWTVEDAAPAMPISTQLAWSSETAPVLTPSGNVTETVDPAMGSVFRLALPADSISAPDAPAVDVGTGDFAISLWVKTTDGAGRELLNKVDSSGRGYSLTFGQGSMTFDLKDQVVAKDGSTGSRLIAYGAAIADDKWHHVLVSVDRDVHDGMAIFVDGKRLIGAGNPLSHRASLDSSAALRFGGGTIGAAKPMSVANLQLFKRSLSDAEAVTLASVCPKGTAEFNGDTGASDSFGHGGSIVGSVTAGVAGKVGGALKFGGGYVNVPDHADLDVGTGDLSLTFWVRSTQSGVVSLLDKRATSPYRGYHVYLSDGNVGLQVADGTYQNYTSWASVAGGAWQHVAITLDRDDPAGLKFYANGVLQTTFDPRGRAGSFANDLPLILGARNDGSGAFLGDLDEVKVFSRALAPSEVAAQAAADVTTVCR